MTGDGPLRKDARSNRAVILCRGHIDIGENIYFADTFSDSCLKIQIGKAGAVPSGASGGKYTEAL